MDVTRLSPSAWGGRDGAHTSDPPSPPDQGRDGEPRDPPSPVDIPKSQPSELRSLATGEGAVGRGGPPLRAASVGPGVGPPPADSLRPATAHTPPLLNTSDQDSMETENEGSAALPAKVWRPWGDPPSEAPAQEMETEEGEGGKDGEEVGPGLPRGWTLALDESCEAVKAQVAAQWEGWDPAAATHVDTIADRRFKDGPIFKETFRLRPRLPSGEMSGEELADKTRAILAHGVQQVIGKAGPQAQGQVIICNPNFHKGHLSTKYKAFADFTFDDILAKFLEAQNSEERIQRMDAEDGFEVSSGGITLDDTEFHFIHVEQERFGVGVRLHDQMRHRRILDLDKWAHLKGSIINPLGKYELSKMPSRCHNWCLAICCVLGRFIADNAELSSKDLLSFRRKCKSVERETEELLRRSGVSMDGPHSIQPDLVAIHKTMGPTEYQINCYFGGGKPSFTFGPNEAKQVNLFFSRDEHHCYLITSILGFLAPQINSRDGRRFCVNCKSTHTERCHHRCSKSSCPLCRMVKCSNTSAAKQWQKAVTCDACRRHMWTKPCLHAHQNNDQNCKSSRRCTLCYSIVFASDKKEHRCGLSKCEFCKCEAGYDHICYMRADAEAGRGKAATRRWYADLECSADAAGRHEPNLLVLLEASSDQPRVFYGTTCVADFLKEAIVKDSVFSNSYLVFHNMSGYDGHFIHAELLRLKMEPRQLIRGQSYLSIDIRSANIRIRDSLLFINNSLDGIAKMYGLAQRKGFFPHRLNRKEHLDAKLYCEEGWRFPRRRWFEPEKMRAGVRDRFECWWAAEDARYAADSSLHYDVPRELYLYCLNDVQVLKDGFETFLADALKKHPGFHPLDNITTPSYCSKVYRAKYMPEETIALLPPDGFCPTGSGCSKSELAWLAWMRKELGLVELRHNRNFRPITIGGFKVDGWGRDASGARFVLEFDGCYFHGCDAVDCGLLPAARDEAERERRLSQRLFTQEKHRRLRRLSTNPTGSPYGPFTFIAVTEHSFHQQMAENSDMKLFVESYIKSLHREPLSLRKSFAGGRTVPIMHSFESDGHVDCEEKMGYADFTSLYPSVNACSAEEEAYPVGHPDVYLGAEVEDLLRRVGGPEQLFGVVFCELDPPSKLRHPVVPLKANDKLLFPLCRTCALEQNPQPCTHSANLRRLQVHIATPELRGALRHGYKIHRFFEVWHFWERSKNLLRSFIMDHYVDKEYASGFPPGVETEEEKKAYAERCSQLLGVPVDHTRFHKNSGKRALSKIICNSFWGFFGKKEDTTSHVFTDSFLDFVKVQQLPSREIVEANLLPGDEHVMIAHKPVKEEAGPKSSLLIATFTTSMARVRLHNVLAAHSEAIVYMDTDSVFYIYSPLHPGPPTPGYFGWLKDELEALYPGQGAYISRFTSTGPKSYAFDVRDRHGKLLRREVKMKGITLTCGAGEVLSHDRLYDLVRAGASSIVVPQMQFKKSIRKQLVQTQDLHKKVSFISNKRRFVPDSPRLDTLPFGHM